MQDIKMEMIKDLKQKTAPLPDIKESVVNFFDR